MAAWAFRPITFDGTNIDDGTTYHSYFEFPDAPMRLIQRRPVEVPIPGDYSFPASPRSQPTSARLVMQIEIRAALTAATILGLRKLFDRYKDFAPLVVEDSDTSPTTWSLQCKVVDLREIDPAHWEVELYANRPIFLATSNKSDNETGINSSPHNWSLSPAPAGAVRTYPRFTITPTTAKSDANDYTRRYQVSIAWRSELPGEDSVGNAYPIDVADDSLDTQAEIAAGRMQADGDDLRVFVDGVEYPRALDGINTTTTKVWVPIHFAPRKQVLLEAAASGSSPASVTGTWNVQEGQSLVGWPERGSFLVDNERVWYGSRTDTSFSLLTRGYANTTAASHAAGAAGDWVEHDIEILTDYSGATAPTAPNLAISASSSTNLAHTYSAFFVAPSLQRYGQLALRFTEDNIRAASMSIFDSSGTLIMADRPAGGSYYPYNNAELYVPCGVKVAASIAFDASGGDVGGGSPLAAGSDIMLDLRIFGIELSTGVERTLATYHKADRTGAKTLTPEAVLSRLRFNVLYIVITGAWDAGLGADALVNSGFGNNDERLQRFAITALTRVKGWAIFAKENASGDTRNAETAITAPRSGTTPEPRDLIAGGMATLANALFGTTYLWVATTCNAYLQPYSALDLVVTGATAGAGTLHWGSIAPVYPLGSRWSETGAVWAENPQIDYAFLILGDGSHVQPEAPSGLEGYASIDNLVVTFDNTTPRTPKIVRAAREDDIYVIRGTLRQTGTSQEIAIMYVCKINESLTIDCLAKTVARSSVVRNFVPGAITPNDPEEWMYVAPGSSSLRWTEATPGTLTINTSWNDAWA